MNLPKLKNSKFFEEAFTHRSYLNEAKQTVSSNERLEFLGDSILSFVVSNYLYKTYSEFDEGNLTNLRSLMVNTKSLSETAKELNIGKLLKLSKGEEESKGRENATLLENSFEAYVGALFLDQGLQSVVKFLTNVLFPKIQEMVDKKAFKDPKSLLQEKIQARKQNSPVYKVLEETGPAHAKIFKVGVYVDGKILGEGIGKSKQIAEVSAAKAALEGKS
ncbi:MAG: ribonuclease III [Candidatus Levybacteria bacterium RIFCSPHIGHO2_02_FULL_37_10]|uniref:Ribonuclease 3 n=1 Tax=Candidatus Portnoybacteria bacterium RIFCSPHIGHO2_01_FULL_40_12b TaxID=1801994 RepID=A0A1G2FC85_9BACT|nr:MAG: ribonuclease III [Candidatus Levybacteria bacterium RIFCSPHIGHO2_02_FULL_37_10]OGZ35695.1 MAG: ribonuclease III [Candidatus Portnoybacteria bacterium RIFCSPHIGHO2_01_FULL_40_12b]